MKRSPVTPPEMLMYRYLRRELGLRYIDVFVGTGIPPARLAAAENGRRKLSAPEMRSVEKFLLDMRAVEQERMAKWLRIPEDTPQDEKPTIH